MRTLDRLWRQSPSLTATALLMSIAFGFSAVGIFLDPRTIGGVPAWLKPAKFAISTAIFSITLAWIFGYLDVTKRLVWLARTITAVLILEVALIDIQAWRGTTSHFNEGTPLDALLFHIMGAAIGVLLLAMIGVCVALFRQRFADPDFGWALRLGMLLTVIGSATGGLMIAPTHEQKLAGQLNQPVTVTGGHTVGAPDGGPGLPGVGWSSQHGDLRVPHFLGLHALQAIPFLAWLVAGWRRESRRGVTTTVFIAAASYLGLIIILTWQALRGESIVQPGPATVAVLGIWLASTVAALVFDEFRTMRRFRGVAYS